MSKKEKKNTEISILKEKPLPLPSKKDIIKTLKEENPPINRSQKYNQIILIVEFKKINQNIGIIKGEYYLSDKLEYRGSLLLPLAKSVSQQPSIWDDLNPGEYKYYGITFDTREKNVLEKLNGFFKKSFEDSRIQDFIPFAGGRKNEA